jgi:hypothetical protein
MLMGAHIEKAKHGLIERMASTLQAAEAAAKS